MGQDREARVAEDETRGREAEGLKEELRRRAARKALALGELVLALKADGLDPEVFAGAILCALRPASPEDAARFRRRGAAYFLRVQESALQAAHASRPSQGSLHPHRQRPTSGCASSPAQP